MHDRLTSWSDIIKQFYDIKESASVDDWVSVSVKCDLVEQDIIFFFESKIFALSDHEKSFIKDEGLLLMEEMKQLALLAAHKRKAIAQESKNHVVAKKGIQAYKNN